MAATDPIAQLTGACDPAVARLDPRAVDDRQSALISWPAVPMEIVRAAGLRPVLVRGGTTPTPAADAHLEHAGFPHRIRQLLDALLTARGGAATVLLPRTCDPDYKAFLYLRELSRRGLVRHAGPILLFDLLQSAAPEVAAHDASRTRALWTALGGDSASIDRLRDEIARANVARAALRRLVALRRGSPRITGSDVLPLIGAFWQLAPEVYAPLAMAAADRIARRQPLHGPRVLLLGAPVDGPALHAAIEALGAVVVGETGPWGLGAAGDDVATDADPFTALAAKYRRDAWGPRTPIADVRRWITQALSGVDAAVVSLPPDDAVFGWDYPWLVEQLDGRGVPHVCVTHDISQPLPDADHDRLAAMLSAAAPRLEAHRG